MAYSMRQEKLIDATLQSFKVGSAVRATFGRLRCGLALRIYNQ